jgi:hypothetical protein
MESKEIEQTLAAEMELGITWAIAKLGPAEIEREWNSQKRLARSVLRRHFPRTGNYHRDHGLVRRGGTGR